MKLTTALFFLVLVFGATQSESFVGYKVYEVRATSEDGLDVLYQLYKSEDDLQLDFWLEDKRLNQPNDIMVPPEFQEEFEKILSGPGLSFKVKIENVEEYVRPQPQKAPKSNGKIEFDSFPSLADIYTYLDDIATRFPNRVTKEQVGTSHEGRPLYTVTITNGGGNPPKNTIFIETTMHAREWIATTTGLFAIKQLVENAGQNVDLLEEFDWVFLPVVNVDGYVYTHNTNRLWRKTRRQISSSTCYGVDGNRNFDFYWGGLGSSSNACSDTFRGEIAFSENETKAVRDVMENLRGKAVFYLSLHTYGRYLIYPWSYTSDLPDDWEDLQALVTVGRDAMLLKSGANYTIGSSTNVLYEAAGCSDDYAKGAENIKFVVTMEGNGNGFETSTSNILPFAEEGWAGIRAMALHVRDYYRNKK